ncbi:MAG: hypothetical protein GF307_12745 [candidate division Zixibacteria bacterium]|nr:hypothetical protein [candidate division Zixibacteria bacterium]
MDIFNTAAQFMEISARTAPKSLGQDYVLTKIIEKEKLEELAAEMDRIGKSSGRENYDRDANSIRNSGAVLFIGVKDAKEIGLNCGACGFDTCAETRENRRKGNEFAGPICAFRLLDMGIALGSAVKTASIMNFDNRVMFRVAHAALNLGWVDWDCVIGIPISATGKSVFFDR